MRMKGITNFYCYYYILIGLPKYTELNISVAAKTIVGYGPASYAVKIRTREDGNNIHICIIIHIVLACNVNGGEVLKRYLFILLLVQFLVSPRT